MAIRVECDECFHSFPVADKHAGRTGKCPECGEPVEVPMPGSRRQTPRSSGAMPSSRGERSARSGGRKSKKSAGSNNGLLIGGIAGGGVLLLLVGVVAFVLSGSNDGPGTTPPQNNPTLASTNAMAAVPTTPAVNQTTPGQPAVQQTSTVAADTMPSPSNPPTAPVQPIASTTPGPATPTTPSSPGTPSNSTAQDLPVLDLPDLIEKVKPSVVRITIVTDDGPGTGSGFVVDKSGVVVTNYHVVEGSNRLAIQFSNGHTGTVKGYMKLIPEKDLAVLQIEADPADLHPIPIATKLPRDGESVLACGAPLGLGFTSTQGIVSATRTSEELKGMGIEKAGTWVQTSTPISPGNSGGPLMNMRGEVIAANTFQFTRGQNLNFGISCLDIAQAVKERSEQLLTVNPSNTPVREASEGKREIKDITGTDRAKQLLGSIEELQVVLVRLSDYAFNSTLRDYVEARIKQGLRDAGMKLGDSPRSVMLVTMDLESTGGNGNYKLVISARVIMRDADDKGNEELVKVWEKEENCGVIQSGYISQGTLPDRVRTKLMTYFKEFAEDVKKGKPAS